MDERTSATQLHVLVQGSGRELCRVQLPLSALNNLAHMVPDVDRERLRATGIDFGQLIERALASGCRPQTLLDASAEERSYRIWIE